MKKSKVDIRACSAETEISGQKYFIEVYEYLARVKKSEVKKIINKLKIKMEADQEFGRSVTSIVFLSIIGGEKVTANFYRCYKNGEPISLNPFLVLEVEA